MAGLGWVPGSAAILPLVINLEYIVFIESKLIHLFEGVRGKG